MSILITISDGVGHLEYFGPFPDLKAAQRKLSKNGWTQDKGSQDWTKFGLTVKLSGQLTAVIGELHPPGKLDNLAKI